MDAWRVKAHSHYCVFRVRLRQKVALLRRDRKFPISALTQSTAESADRCGECEWALRDPVGLKNFLADVPTNIQFGHLYNTDPWLQY